MESIMKDMATKDFNEFALSNFNINLYENEKERLIREILRRQRNG